MKRFLIKLFPLTPFFFGSERTFGDKQNINYFAKSNPFPQQTSVLGMLRKEILIQSKKFKENRRNYSPQDKEEIKDLIGAHSFRIGSDNHFGKILKISPVFIANEHDYFIKIPFDEGITFEKKVGKTHLNHKLEFVPFASGYDPKKGLPKGFISINGDTKNFDEIFVPFVKVGNAKDKTESDEEKFFKQLFYVLKDGYSFAFFAELDFDLKSSIVFLGADNSSFKMVVDEVNDSISFETLFVNNVSPEKIVLLSEALVDENLFQFCDFAITEVNDFRTINFDYGKFNGKSVKYEMLKRGSVLFPKEGKKNDIEMLLNKSNLQKIGYNIYR